MRRTILAVFLFLLASCTSSDVEPVTTASVVDEPSTSTTARAPATPSTAADSVSSTTTEAVTPTTTVSPLTGLAYEKVAGGLAFPVFVDTPAGDDRLFVVTKDGQIHIIKDGKTLVEPFLDISEQTNNDGEQGLLGLAFHPDYAANGLFYVHYSDRHGDTKIFEYRVSSNPDLADPETARLILVTTQPAGNHNGGMIAFGPDGYFYIGLGDGGGANDRYGNGQRPDTVLGALLRLDVDAGRPDGGVAYAIPPDNPFVNGGGAAEVWAYGLRNPWRFSFDGDLLYIGDVGQALWEEIDVAAVSTGGLNYGWPIMEGSHCFTPGSGCDTGGLYLPATEYSHGEGCSVTGGYVYRGSAIPELTGRYLYSDYCGGWLRSFVYEDGAATDAKDHTEQVGALVNVTSFGTDAWGEIYVTTAGGDVWKVVGNRS
ncbi:MAG: PQQ-dependent sugar dehydrogenase [Acidimicrobiia bacterium]|nr:PQQ-dependent sugar dehydrogenase [Acidimicrobiia bacterium]